jgi:RNA polymerase sigma factor (sigma-70 family)
MRRGDQAARDELIRAACDRLERLTRKMRRSFPNVPGRLADSDDVFMGAVCRLMRGLENLDPPPASTREFFAIAATCIRSELLDLARHYGCQRRRGDKAAVPLDEGSRGDAAHPAAPTEDAPMLERWTRFHQAVEQLPAEEREVFGLKFYHGWTEEQIAELFGVSARTVRRRWASAGARLVEALGGAMPEA